MIHIPVLRKELIDNLDLKPGMTVVDATLGAGGHSEAVLEKILPGGILISIDWDVKAIHNFEKKLEQGISIAKKEQTRSVRSAPVNIHKNDDQSFGQFIILGNREGKIVGYRPGAATPPRAIGCWYGANDNYKNIEEIIRGLGPAVRDVDAVFADLGFSSDQIENAARGFSLLKDGSLDMRYSPDDQKLTAAIVVNKYTENQLAAIFKNYGEEKFSKKIAAAIIKARKVRNITGTKELAEITSKAIPQRLQKNKLHPATKVFQALRIEVNRELENLKYFLSHAPNVLASEGRLAIISFHSLEDRLVKNMFRLGSRDCICPANFPKCVCNHRKSLEIITKKPILAGGKEISENPRSRSAKLRVAQKI